MEMIINNIKSIKSVVKKENKIIKNIASEIRRGFLEIERRKLVPNSGGERRTLKGNVVENYISQIVHHIVKDTKFTVDVKSKFVFSSE